MKFYVDSSQINTTSTFSIPWDQMDAGNATAKIAWETGPIEYVEKENRLKERTFVMIKPDAFERGLVGEVLDLVSQRGLKLIACKTVHMTKADCEQHYSHHVGKDFYPGLVEFMTSGPSLAILFEGENACGLIRQLIGDSKHPSQVQPGSIRGRYAMDFPRNLIHGSKTYDEASHEYRLYLAPKDIFDEYRVANIQEEFAERKERALAILRNRIKTGVKLGDEVFAPDVLQEGDWVASADGVSLITSVHPTIKTKEKRTIVEREDYFNHWWKQPRKMVFSPETHNSSIEWTWAGSALFLVGRNGEFLDNFRTPPLVNEKNGKQYIFKAGRFLPYFKKKSAPFNPYKSKEPFATTYDGPNGFVTSDIFDPVNQVVVKVTSKNDFIQWRVLVHHGQELAGKQSELAACSTSQAQARLKLWGKKFNPGGMSILLRYGVPWAATYGDMKIHDLKGK